MPIKSRPFLIGIILCSCLILTACNSRTIEVTRLVEVKDGTILPSETSEPGVTQVVITLATVALLADALL